MTYVSVFKTAQWLQYFILLSQNLFSYPHYFDPHTKLFCTHVLMLQKKKVSLVLSHTPYLYERMYVDRRIVNPNSHLSERAPRLFGVCIRQGAGPELHCVRVNLCSLRIVSFWLCQKWTLDPKRSQKTFPPVTSTKCWQFLSTTPLPEGVHVCCSGYCKP